MNHLRAKPVNRLSMGLVAFFFLFALTIDLYWLVNHDRLPESGESHAPDAREWPRAAGG